MRWSSRLVVFGSVAVVAACSPSPVVTQTLEVTPTTLALQIGEARPVTAETVSGTTRSAATGATWTSSDPAIVAVSTTNAGSATLQGVSAGAATVTATLKGKSATMAVTVSARPVTLSRIELTPANATVAKGGTLQFTATGVFSDGTTQDFTASATWASSDETRATVSTAGLLSGLAPGTTEVTAAKDGLTGRLTVSVTSAALLGLDLTPAGPTLSVAARQQFTATARLSDGTTQVVTNEAAWSSAETTVASVDGAGMVTTHAAGTSVLTATLNGLTGTTTLTVSAATLTSLELSPAAPSLARGSTTQLTATGRYSDGSSRDVTGQATWLSATPAVASVSSTGLATALTVGTSSISATLGSLSGNATLTVTAATLVALAVTPAATSLARGRTQQLTATGTYSDASMQDLSAQVTWTSGTPATATVSGTGLVTAAEVGTSTLTATLGARSGTATLTVTPAELVSIAVSPATASIARGRTQAFVATGTYSDSSTQNLSATATWTSGTPAVASVTSTGVASGLAVGTSLVTATLGTVSGNATLTVTPAVLVSLAVTASNLSIARGRTQQFVATGTMSDGTTQNVSSTATWTSGTTATATVSTTGLATAVAIGTSLFTATSGAVSGSATLTVTIQELVSIAVTAPSLSIARGRTQQFVATGTYSDNSTQVLTSVATWATGTPATATVNPTGLVTAVAVGTSTVTATSNTVTGSAILTVTAAEIVSIAVTASSLSIAKGRTQAFVATATLSDGTTQNVSSTATWASGTPATATVSNVGLATSVAVGTSLVSATVGAVSGSATLTVTPAELVSLAVTASSLSIARGRTQQFVATGTLSDATTQNLTATASWTSGTPATATVSSTGLATAVAVGTSLVTATLNSVSGSATLTVTPAELVSIAVTASGLSVARGRTQQFVATGTLSDATTQNLTATATWTSGAPATATVSSTGLASALAVGTSLITATFNAVSGSATLTVTPAALVSIAVTPAGPVPLNQGTTVQLTANGTYSDATVVNITALATWTSGTPAAVTVSNLLGSQGLATAVAGGSSTVSATLDGVSASTVVTVTVKTLVSIAVTPATNTLAGGTTQQLTATGTYSDATTQDLSTSVTWASTVTNTATVSGTGLVTAVNAGSTSISATLNAISGSAAVTVTTPVTLTSIAVTPATPSVARGRTQQFVATGTYSDASTQNLTATVTWASSAAGTATIAAAGLATTLLAGTTTISATLGAVSGSTLLTVTAPEVVSIAVTPATPTLAKGRTQAFVATATMTDATTVNVSATVTWASSDPATATITAAGLVTCVEVGSSTISATLGAVLGSTPLTVTLVALESITLTGRTTVATNGAVKLTATGTYSDATTSDVTSTATWASDNAAAGVSNLAGVRGVVKGLAASTTTPNITATLGAVVGTLAVRVRDTNAARVGRCGPGVVISQIYGGGGNASATYRNDFVELHNPGPNTVNLVGLSIQYASATGTSWSPLALTGSIPAGGYYLALLATGGAVGLVLPTADITNTTINLSGTAGKVALVNGTAALSGACPTGNLLDLVGYGATASCVEGTFAAAPTANTAWMTRGASGCADANANNLDFSVGTVTPRNSATPGILCSCSVNETSVAEELHYCNLQFPASTGPAAGTVSEGIYARVFQAGVTEPAGFDPSITVEVGFGGAGVDPTAFTTWSWWPTSANVQVGNDDEYQGVFVAPSSGSYNYTSRVTRDGVNWTSCDLNGAGSNAGNDFLPFVAGQLGVLTVP